MNKERRSRRGFISRSLLLAATAALVNRSRTDGSCAAGKGRRPGSIRLGAPVFVRTDDPDELAQAHRKVGYRAAYCPKVSLKDTDRIRAISEAYRKHDVVIAEVGRWCNLLDSDAEKRRANLENVTDGLALADAIGALCCVDIAGSFNPKSWSGPDPRNLTDEFFDAAVENARKIIDAVKPRRAKFCYEMMGWSYPDSADSYLKMIKAIDRDGFGVHLDPCNLINSPIRFYRNTDVINECFDKLGKWVVSCHAKDLAWEIEASVHFREVRPGTGSLDYKTFLRRQAELAHQPPLMIEHLSGAAEYDKAREHIMAVGKEIGVRF
ncbi:sugar phosphate isomerase/epimerase [Candidatus Sumerlaeota bacterium]|nr:sugar phosphate isomerase/epimerase [Candidatus Sumerlaeota bacterium]